MKDQPRILVIGEAPGRHEDEEGRPFVGRSGDVVRDWLWTAGVNPIDASYVNVVSCWPKRTPTSQEVQLCRPNLISQVTAVAPSYCLVLGGVALGALIPWNWRISEARGLWFRLPISGTSAWAMATYHPSATLRNSDLIPTTRDDYDDFGLVAREEMTPPPNQFCARCKRGDVEVTWGETLGFCKGCATMLKVPV